MINKLSNAKIGTNHNKMVGSKIQFILNLKYKNNASIYNINVISNIHHFHYASLLFNADIDIIPPNTITTIMAGTSHFSMPE